MIKTDIDIKDLIFTWVSESAVAGMISGSVYKDQRPLNSDKEDIVISILTRNTGKQIQEVIVNINIYVPDIRRDNDMIENTSRLRALCSQAADDFDYTHYGDKIFELEYQQVYRVNDLDWHVVNNRIRTLYNNES